MKNQGWLFMLFACSACDVLSFEGRLFPSEENSRNCVVNPPVCTADQLCDQVRKVCISGNGTCVSSGSCIAASSAFCNSGICVSCNALGADPDIGDRRCAEWSMQRGGSQRLCISGACKECRSNADCRQSGRTFCDQVKNVCVGCVKDADCSAAGSMICRTDESMLGTGELRTKVGECVEAKDVAYVKNQMGSCSDTATDAGTVANPHCQIQAAITRGKSFIRVLSGGTDYNAIQVNANPQQRVMIYGPGQGSVNIQAAVVGNGAGLTLQDIGIKQTGTQGVVQCDAGGRLTLKRVLVNGSSNANYGIYAEQCINVTIERTKVDSINGHGIWINGGSEHRIVNTVIVRSGSINNGRTALRIGAGVVNSMFAFNTIVANVAGVQCESNQTITDSIIQGNSISVQVSGCNTARVITMGAMLVDSSITGSDPRVTGDSMTVPVVVDQGMQLPAPNPPVVEDYFGNPRPAGGGFDVGFHEYR